MELNVHDKLMKGCNTPFFFFASNFWELIYLKSHITRFTSNIKEDLSNVYLSIIKILFLISDEISNRNEIGL